MKTKRSKKARAKRSRQLSTGVVGVPIQQSTAKTKCQPPGRSQFSGDQMARRAKCPRAENPLRLRGWGSNRSLLIPSSQNLIQKYVYIYINMYMDRDIDIDIDMIYLTKMYCFDILGMVIKRMVLRYLGYRPVDMSRW